MTMTLLSSLSHPKTLAFKTNDILVVDVDQKGLDILPENITAKAQKLSAMLLDDNLVVDQVASFVWAHDMKMHLQKA